jgi:5-methylcytosine-specific restriction endonuclease McrA
MKQGSGPQKRAEAAPDAPGGGEPERLHAASAGGRVLVLSAGMEPHRIVPWQKAIQMFFLGKVEVLEEYDEILYRSPTLVIRMPAVVRLLRVVRGIKRAIKFSRINVFTRDRFTCQYCGTKKRMRELNYDHVVPRHLGGRTTWENIVSSCYPCNSRKKNRTPEMAGMTLLSIPVKPKSLPLTTHLDLGPRVPAAWADYVAWMHPSLGGGAIEDEAAVAE